MRYSMKKNQQSQPVEAGKEYTAFIESVGGKGDGIARVRGFVVFIPKVKKGDYVKFKITKVLEKVSFGEFVEKLDPPKKPEVPPVFKKPVEKKEDVSHLLNTEEDSEDFGVGDDEDEDDF